MQRETCSRCGARLFRDAPFCARCDAPVELTERQVAEFMIEVDAAAGRWRSPRKTLEPWRPEARHERSPPAVIRSRWARSALTFGPAGRIAVTVAILGFIAWALLYSGSPGSGLVFGVVSVWVLKDLWKAARIPQSSDSDSGLRRR